MNLVKAMHELARIEADSQERHADINLWGAPSECHEDANRIEESRIKDWEERWGMEVTEFFRKYAVHYDWTIDKARKLYDRLVSQMTHPEFR